MFNKVFSIDKGDEIMLKFDDVQVVKLSCLEYKITCNSCGAVGFQGGKSEGIDVDYWIHKDQFDILII